MNGSTPKPRSNRSIVAMHAELIRSGGGVQTVQVEDLSIDGCCVRGYFRVGDNVSLRLPRIGLFHAHVRWARGGRAGFAFVRASQ